MEFVSESSLLSLEKNIEYVTRMYELEVQTVPVLNGMAELLVRNGMAKRGSELSENDQITYAGYLDQLIVIFEEFSQLEQKLGLFKPVSTLETLQRTKDQRASLTKIMKTGKAAVH